MYVLGLQVRDTSRILCYGLLGRFPGILRVHPRRCATIFLELNRPHPSTFTLEGLVTYPGKCFTFCQRFRLGKPDGLSVPLRMVVGVARVDT